MPGVRVDVGLVETRAAAPGRSPSRCSGDARLQHRRQSPVQSPHRRPVAPRLRGLGPLRRHAHRSRRVVHPQLHRRRRRTRSRSTPTTAASRSTCATAFRIPYTRADADGFLDAAWAQQPESDFAIASRSEVIGGIGLHRQTRRAPPLGRDRLLARRAVLGPRHRHPGGARAQPSGSSPPPRWSASTPRVFDWNPGSARVLEKAGYHPRGAHAAQRHQGRPDHRPAPLRAGARVRERRGRSGTRPYDGVTPRPTTIMEGAAPSAPHPRRSPCARTDRIRLSARARAR